MTPATTAQEGIMAFREASLETTAAPATVWRVWSDVNHWPEWNPDMNESRLDGPLKLGATGVINTKSGGKHDVVVTHFEDGKSFELESTAMPGTKMAIRATIAPSAAGSRITQAFEPRGLLAPIVGPMMGGMILKTFNSVLDGLKQKVESGASA
jgi:Polyketide cyclase / dehydrase and lipid transport